MCTCTPTRQGLCPKGVSTYTPRKPHATSSCRTRGGGMACLQARAHMKCNACAPCALWQAVPHAFMHRHTCKGLHTIVHSAHPPSKYSPPTPNKCTKCSLPTHAFERGLLPARSALGPTTWPERPCAVRVSEPKCCAACIWAAANWHSSSQGTAQLSAGGHTRFKSFPPQKPMPQCPNALKWF